MDTIPMTDGHPEFAARSPESRPVCVITGGSSGIGLATAGEFAVRGYRLALCGRDPARLERAQTELRKRQADGCGFQDVRVWAIDLTEPDVPLKFLRAAYQVMGRLDVLVNNAGTAPCAPLEQLDDETFDRLLQLNVRAVFQLTREAVRLMRDQALDRDAVIVNVSSLASVDPFPGFSAYGASKAWVELFTQAVARETREERIRVFAVRPGAIETPLLRQVFPEFPAEQTLPPEAVAQVIGRLCEPEFRYCSGETVSVFR